MKPHLKRTDATLHQLGNLSTTSYPEASAAKNRTYSFEIRRAAINRNAPEQQNKAPNLPKFKSPSLSSYPNSVNPALEMNLFPEIQTDVTACEAELQQTVRQIQDIYLEGPLVDGWLESHSSEVPPGTAERQMDYVEELGSLEHGKVTCESPRAGYRLCGLDAAGNMWSRPCPPEQLPSVSIAIARYQKLRQLLERKQYVENRLSELAQDGIIINKS